MEKDCYCCFRYWFGCCHVVLNWVGCCECCWLVIWLLGRLDVASWLHWNCVDYCRNISSGKWWGIVSLVDSCICATGCCFWRRSSRPICWARLSDSTTLLRRLLWLLLSCKMVIGRLCVVSWLCWGGSDIQTASIIAAILLLVRGASLSVWLITVSAARFVLFSVDQVVLFEEPDWVAVLSSL